jgi:hypothetical protein
MTYLTSNQLKQYSNKGYVAPINVLTKDVQTKKKPMMNYQEFYIVSQKKLEIIK